MLRRYLEPADGCGEQSMTEQQTPLRNVSVTTTATSPICLACAQPLPPGRPRQYCNDRCRQTQTGADETKPGQIRHRCPQPNRGAPQPFTSARNATPATSANNTAQTATASASASAPEVQARAARSSSRSRNSYKHDTVKRSTTSGQLSLTITLIEWADRWNR